jgi:LEA14-like dessication related protein
MYKKIITSALVVFFAVSCAHVSNYFVSKISVNVDKVSVENISGFESINLKLDLFVRNENVFPIYVTGFTYNVVVGKSIIATGENPENESFMVGAQSSKKLSFDLSVHPKKAGQEFMKAFVNMETEMRVYGKVYANTELGDISFNYSHTTKMKE